LDESSFVKKGEHSVGVKRQWCGTLGKKENCQVGVFLAYVSPRGDAFLDRRLYLPEEWAQDTTRREASQVPAEISFRTKGELGQEMLEQAWAHGVPMQWVTGDEAYGDMPYVRERIAAESLLYVLAVSCNTHAWTAKPGVESADNYTFGRPRKHPRLVADAAASQEVAQIVAAWPEAHWQRLAIAAGEKGPRSYDWAAARVVIRKGKLPGAELWLLARRSIEKPDEIAYYLSNAPVKTPLLTLAQVAGARWRIEQAFEEAKGEAGLDEYEVRYWASWHRHITLSLLAHSWLTAMRSQARQQEQEKKAALNGERHLPAEPEAMAELTVAEVQRLLVIALPLPPQSAAFRLAWSQWRREKRQQARRSHYRRRGATFQGLSEEYVTDPP
jgi:SRSO17 transposase